MRLSTRLLLPLLAVVVAVMGAYGWWAMRQREETLLAESERETRAYARALGLAVERAIRHPEFGDVQDIIDRISQEATVYGVLVYDTSGEPAYLSGSLDVPAETAPAWVLEEVLGSGTTRTLYRDLGTEPVVAVVRPLIDETGTVVGALEVANPLASVVAEHTHIRQRFMLNTVTLVVALSLLVTWLVGRYVQSPIDRFLEAVRTLARGDLSHRVDPALAAGELGEVAEELNRMAAGLEDARAQVVREAEERVTLGRRLQQSEKMAAVGKLAAGLAHEIGAPLHVIRGRAEQLQRRDPGPETRDRQLGVIITQIDRITLIVSNLLGYARRKEPREMEIDLLDVVRGVAEFVETELARAEVELTLELPDRPVATVGDPDLLHQVFLNLTMNAMHAVEGTEGARAIHVRAAAAGDEAIVDVVDSGPGIPSDVRERIFDPFFTTKDGPRGTGLGLAVALGIVEDHGGRLEAVDPPSETDGACLRVRLPLKGGPARDGSGGMDG